MEKRQMHLEWLKIIGLVIMAIGGVVTIVGLSIFLLGVLTAQDGEDLLIYGIYGAIYGISFIMSGGLFCVLAIIEDNTRRSAISLEKLLSKIEVFPAPVEAQENLKEQ